MLPYGYVSPLTVGCYRKLTRSTMLTSGSSLPSHQRRGTGKHPLNIALLSLKFQPGDTQVYDYILTFTDEVEYIWKAPRSLVAFLFFITRYLPFFDTSMSSIGEH